LQGGIEGRQVVLRPSAAPNLSPGRPESLLDLLLVVVDAVDRDWLSLANSAADEKGTAVCPVRLVTAANL